MEACKRLQNDLGKLFFYELSKTVHSVGGGDIHVMLTTSNNKSQCVAINAIALFQDHQQCAFVSVPDVEVSVSRRIAFVKDGSAVGEGQLGIHMMVGASNTAPVYGLVVARTTET